MPDPGANEFSALTKLFESRLAHYATHPEEAKMFATDPLGSVLTRADAAERLDLTTVGDILPNLDDESDRSPVVPSLVP